MFCASSLRLRVGCLRVGVGRCGLCLSPGCCLSLLRLSQLLNPLAEGCLKTTGVVCEVRASSLETAYCALEVAQVSTRVARE